MSITTATTHSSTPTHPLGEPSLPALPNVLFDLVAKNLSQADIATLPKLCRETKRLTSIIRSGPLHLDLSHKPKRKKEMRSTDWKHAFRLHPNFTGINVGGYDEISIEMRDILVENLKKKNIRRVIMSAPTTFRQEYPMDMPIGRILRALNTGNYQLNNPFTLEHLDLSGDSSPGDFLCAVKSLAYRSPNLKTLRLPIIRFDENQWDRGVSLVRSLGPNLELLGPHWAPLDDEMIAEITSKNRFEREKLRGCQLTFRGDQENNTVEKRWELLRFLPLSTMTVIELQGVRNEYNFGPWPAGIKAKDIVLSAEMIDHIAAQLKENKKLQVLDLTGLIPSEELVPSLVQLINSIESDQLRELILITNLNSIPDMTLIEEALRAKLPSWKKIEKIQINNLTLDQLRPAADAASSSI